MLHQFNRTQGGNDTKVTGSLNTESEWLLSAVKDSQRNAIVKALKRGGDPNELDQDTELTAFQESILTDNLDVLSLLIEGIPNESVKVADLNLVGHDFRLPILIASDEKLRNRITIMKKIIRTRTLFNEDLFDKFLSICVAKFGNDTVVKENDFALLSHYVSRICATNIGKMLANNNDDRYLVHLCQYSLAEKDDIELEGWFADEFLPIRIFSLFEILVKLKKDIILTAKKEEWCTQIRCEILVEMETLKIEQERISIADAENMSKIERESLYAELSAKFFDTVYKNPNREFCLASGYRGHAIYISFVFNSDSNEVMIRYDNLGRGVIRKSDNVSRHITKNGVIYPRFISVNINNKEKIKNFINTLFLIKEEKLEKNKKSPSYDNDREDRLSVIYDDNNTLGFREMNMQFSGMPEQQADTCVATSHQVGLLSRFKDENFYNWIVAEEKRCIVQVNRNKGALQAERKEFWNKEIINYVSPEFADCCSPDALLEALIQSPYLEQLTVLTSRELGEGFSQWIEKVFDALLHRNQKQELLDFCETLENFVLPYATDFSTILKGLLFSKIALLEDSAIEKIQFLQKGVQFLLNALGNINKHRPDFTSTFWNTQFISHDFEVGVHYHLGLVYFYLNNLKKSAEHFKLCQSCMQIFREKNQQKPNKIFRTETEILLSLGFINLQDGNIATAEHYFSAILDGYNFDSRPDGFFGLGVIHYRKSKDEGFSQEIRKTYSNNALSFFKEAKSSKNQNISKKSAKYFDLLLKESTSLTQQNSPAPTLLPLHNAQRSQSEPPEAESSSKRARKDGWN